MPKTLIQQSRDVSAEQKAIYHQVAGAGKSKVKREFFDLSDSDFDRIAERIDSHLERVANESR